MFAVHSTLKFPLDSFTEMIVGALGFTVEQKQEKFMQSVSGSCRFMDLNSNSMQRMKFPAGKM